MNERERMMKLLAANPATLAKVDAVLDGTDFKPGKADDDCRLITHTEAARRLNLSRPTVYRLARAGRLAVVPLDGIVFCRYDIGACVVATILYLFWRPAIRVLCGARHGRLLVAVRHFRRHVAGHASGSPSARVARPGDHDTVRGALRSGHGLSQ